MLRGSRIPPVCERCSFAEEGRCTLLAQPTARNINTLLEEGACEPARSLRSALRRAWPWLSASQVQDLAQDGMAELVVMAHEKGEEGMRSTYGDRTPNAYLFSQVQPPFGWAYRHLLRRQLRRRVREREREVSQEQVSALPLVTSAEAPHRTAAQGSPLQELLGIDRRSALLIYELLTEGDVDREVWKHVLGWEDAFYADQIDHVVQAVRLRLGRSALELPPASAEPLSQLAERITLDRARPDSAITNALLLARYKFSVLATQQLSEWQQEALPPEEQLDLRALMQRHFAPGILTESQAYAAVKATNQDRGRFASKQIWRSHYRRGAESSLRRLLAVEGWGAAVADSLTGFRRVLGLPANPEDGAAPRPTNAHAGESARGLP